MKHQTFIPLLRACSLYRNDHAFRLLIEQVEEYAGLDFEMEVLRDKPANLLTVLSRFILAVLLGIVSFTPNPSSKFVMVIISAFSFCTLVITLEGLGRMREKMRIQNERLCIKTYLEEIVCSEDLIQFEKLLGKDESIEFEIVGKFFQTVRAIMQLDPRDYQSIHTFHLRIAIMLDEAGIKE